VSELQNVSAEVLTLSGTATVQQKIVIWYAGL